MPAVDDLLTRSSAGPVAAAYLGLLVREWEPAMPPALIPSRFLGLLYVLHDRADELGHVRPRHGADVVQDLVRVACLNTEDTVRHLDAAVAVGFVVVQRGPPPPTPSARPPSTPAAPRTPDQGPWEGWVTRVHRDTRRVARVRRAVS